MNAFKFTFKLRADASPHIYLNDLRRYLKGDEYMHPSMEKMLLLLKKTKMSYIRLATIKEMVVAPDQYCHIERALEPTITGYVKIDWTEEEIEKYLNNTKKFWTDIFQMYSDLGYESSPKTKITNEELLSILDTVKDQELKKEEDK